MNWIFKKNYIHKGNIVSKTVQFKLSLPLILWEVISAISDKYCIVWAIRFSKVMICSSFLNTLSSDHAWRGGVVQMDLCNYWHVIMWSKVLIALVPRSILICCAAECTVGNCIPGQIISTVIAPRIIKEKGFGRESTSARYSVIHQTLRGSPYTKEQDDQSGGKQFPD